MDIYVDSANLDDIKKGLAVGLCDGVTTNPTLIAREKVTQEKRIKEICELVTGPVHAETLSLVASEIVEEGREYHSWAKNVVVKIPFCEPGLEAVKILNDAGIPTNVTLIFSAAQALLAAKAGATYVCPFVGRLDDIGGDGMGVIDEIVAFLSNYPAVDTEVIVASIRTPDHVMTSASIGADIATVPSKVIAQMAKHPLTDSGIEAFLEDAKKMKEA
jgi:transaldolase